MMKTEDDHMMRTSFNVQACGEDLEKILVETLQCAQHEQSLQCARHELFYVEDSLLVVLQLEGLVFLDSLCHHCLWLSL